MTARADAIVARVQAAAVDGVVPMGGLTAIAGEFSVSRARVSQLALSVGIHGTRRRQRTMVACGSCYQRPVTRRGAVLCAVCIMVPVVCEWCGRTVYRDPRNILNNARSGVGLGGSSHAWRCQKRCPAGPAAYAASVDVAWVRLPVTTPRYVAAVRTLVHQRRRRRIQIRRDPDGAIYGRLVPLRERGPRGTGDFDLERVIGGCADTLSGWHVPSTGRRYTLGEMRTVREVMLTAWVEYQTRHTLAPQDGRPRCLCGWTPTEDAMLALRAMYEAVIAVDPDAGARVEAVVRRG